MNRRNFTQADQENFVKFLNFVVEHTEFKKGFGYKDAIAATKLLNKMQVDILPLIEAHIFEVKEIKEVEPAPVVKKGKGAK